MRVQIFATGLDGHREEITDLYWFEEQHVHGFDDDDWGFEIIIDGAMVATDVKPCECGCGKLVKGGLMERAHREDCRYNER